MDKVIYQKTVSRSPAKLTKTTIILTEEVNRLVIWREHWENDEDMTLTVTHHFPKHQKNEAIEWAVAEATKSEEADQLFTLQKIAGLLDREEWNAETTATIADILRFDQGFTIRQPEDREPEDDDTVVLSETGVQHYGAGGTSDEENGNE